jgi:hypothetical protein
LTEDKGLDAAEEVGEADARMDEEEGLVADVVKAALGHGQG